MNPIIFSLIGAFSMFSPEAILDRPEGSVYNSIGQITLDLKANILYETETTNGTNTRTFREHRGSGSLISPCLVVTNQHVIGLNDSAADNINTGFLELKNQNSERYNFKVVLEPLNLKFHVGNTGSESQPFSETIPATVIAIGDPLKDENRDKSNKLVTKPDRVHDWALLKLKTPLQGRFTPLVPVVVDENFLQSCKKFTVAGYPQLPDQNAPDLHLRALNNCSLVEDSIGRLGFWIDCEAKGGVSGGPIFCADNEAAPAFIGITVAVALLGPKNKEKMSTFALRFSENDRLLNTIKANASCE